MRTNIHPMASVPPVPTPQPDPVCVLRRAHKLLQAASPDWQRTGPTDGTLPLHWPAAVAAASAHIEHALRLMEKQ
jgi:hypothetical protein